METIYYQDLMRPKDAAKVILDANPSELMVAFNFENYLFTDYVLQEEMQAVMVVKSCQEKELYFSGYRSGYEGAEPSNTRDVLVELGMTYEMADRLKYSSGIRIHFTPDGELDFGRIETTFLFESRPALASANHIFFDQEHMLVNLQRRQLYFLKITKDTMRSLLKTIDLLQLDAFVYYLGQDNNQVRDFSIPYAPTKLERVGEQILDGPFVIIEGSPFDIVCFLGPDAPACIINNLYYFITGKLLFRENTSGPQRILCNDDKPGRSKRTVKAKRLVNVAEKLLEPVKLLKSVKGLTPVKSFRGETELYEKIIFEVKHNKPGMR